MRQEQAWLWCAAGGKGKPQHLWRKNTAMELRMLYSLGFWELQVCPLPGYRLLHSAEIVQCIRQQECAQL